MMEITDVKTMSPGIAELLTRRYKGKMLDVVYRNKCGYRCRIIAEFERIDGNYIILSEVFRKETYKINPDTKERVPTFTDVKEEKRINCVTSEFLYIKQVDYKPEHQPVILPADELSK